MTPALRTRDDYRRADGVLLVLRRPPEPPPAAPGQPPIVPANPNEGDEVLLAVWHDGRATALAGHVDLGTGIRTAYGQLVAEELELPFERVQVVLGSTAAGPNQGPTIASASIQIHAEPLRRAAAQARAWLVARAAALELAEVDLSRLLGGRHVELTLDPSTPLKSADTHRLIGQSQARVDIPAKVSGDSVYVHDVRLPGMLHGRVVRPPYAGLDAGEFVGRTLEGVDEASVAHVPGLRRVFTQGDFVGVVCEREEHAEAAMRALAVRWKPWPGGAAFQPALEPGLGLGSADVEAALRTNPAVPRVVAEHGDVDAALEHAAGEGRALRRTYLWPYQLHASIGPSCAVAQWHGAEQQPALTVWAGTQNPHVLRADLARLMGVADPAVEVIRLEASGCYGRNGADDVAADAALLARAAGAPVRVQLTREQEHAWEPKGAAQLMDVAGALDVHGRLAAYDFSTSYPSNAAPTLALLLTRTIEPVAQAFAMGDRTSVPPYDTSTLRVTVNDMPPVLRASWLRGVSALPNSFAHESFVDEAAHAAGRDPVAFRLEHLSDPRAIELVRATAARAGWAPRSAPRRAAEGDWLHGQGFAYARYIHSKFPGFGAAWSAWVADVDVHSVTGEVAVRRVVVGHDAGMVVNPAGVEHQIHGNVLQTTSRALKERMPVGAPAPAAGPGRALAAQGPSGPAGARDWGSYPILSFREVPVVEVLHMPRPGEPPLGVGESASVPGTAAIANAIFDATGVRLRQPPFTPEVVRAALGVAEPPVPTRGASQPAAAAAVSKPSAAPNVSRKPLWARAAALAAAAFGIGAAAVGLRPSVAPFAPLAPVALGANPYSAEVVARGAELALLGNCISCHTAPGGAAGVGGRAFHTPYGTVWSTNLTPDVATGLGGWSFDAFRRAMRHGISRDGHHLYPVFPYTAFTRLADDELTALYAWTRSLVPQAATPPPADMRAPFGARPLLAAWNALHLQPGPVAVADRGAWLLETIGHCGSCHTPRNALGAERSDAALAGSFVEGWEAPPLAGATRGRPWSEADLFAYLREGVSPNHGSASGPMAEVVRNLARAPEGDVRALARYLATLQPQQAGSAPRPVEPAGDRAVRRVGDRPTGTATARLPGAAQRLFEGSCGACHHDGSGPPTLNPNVPLDWNPNLHGAHADNLVRLVLDGIAEPANPHWGTMPAYRHALDDAQIEMLVAWMRARFAPGAPPWSGLRDTIARLRGGSAP